MSTAAHAAAVHPPLKTLRAVPRSDVRPMTKEESETFVRAVLAISSGKDAPKSAADLCAEFTDAPLAMKIMVKRLTLAEADLRFHTFVVLFLASLCDTPARVVLWAHYLVQRAYGLAPGAAVTTAILAEDFPVGFPTDDGMIRVWDAQKRHDAPCGNALDGAAAWRRPEMPIAA